MGSTARRPVLGLARDASRARFHIPHPALSTSDATSRTVSMQHHLDPHERPPEHIRRVYKRYQKMKPGNLELDADIVDPVQHMRLVGHLGTHHLAQVFRHFLNESSSKQSHDPELPSAVAMYEHDDMPGLRIVPSLLPPPVQTALLSRLLHRDLSNPAHLTNIHTHYTLAYPPSNASFFSLSPSSQEPVATPIDPAVHKPLTVSQLVNKKMRWTTLGGQYDWTAKQYPDAPPPPFPEDIKTLLESIFTDTKAEAAIVNLYSPGDTLSVHRDVAEASSHGLVSLSLGCDAIFVIGTDDNVVTLRLKSGSAVYMSGPSRYAWHGVPQIVAGTCPDHLQQWPGRNGDEHDAFDEWKGWMAGKRVNLNVRQMWDWT